jgi:hypothetical protein
VCVCVCVCVYVCNSRWLESRGTRNKSYIYTLYIHIYKCVLFSVPCVVLGVRGSRTMRRVVRLRGGRMEVKGKAFATASAKARASSSIKFPCGVCVCVCRYIYM